MILINTRNTALGNQLVSACLTIMLILVIISINPLALIKTKKKPYKIATIDWQPQHIEVEIEQKNKKFAESNPNVPENIPDKTHLISTRNQQAAQENPLTDQINQVPLPKSFKGFRKFKNHSSYKPWQQSSSFQRSNWPNHLTRSMPHHGETFSKKKTRIKMATILILPMTRHLKTINLTSGNSAAINTQSVKGWI